MADTKHAIIVSGFVDNVVMCDPTTPGGSAYVAAMGASATVVDLASVSPTPGVGWSYDATTGAFSAPPPPPAPESLVAVPSSIPADGTTASTVTWTAAEGATVPATVQFNVNGVLETVGTSGTTAEIGVTSTTAGDTITVRCFALSATVSVT